MGGKGKGKGSWYKGKGYHRAGPYSYQHGHDLGATVGWTFQNAVQGALQQVMSQGIQGVLDRALQTGGSSPAAVPQPATLPAKAGGSLASSILQAITGKQAPVEQPPAVTVEATHPQGTGAASSGDKDALMLKMMDMLTQQQKQHSDQMKLLVEKVTHENWAHEQEDVPEPVAGHLEEAAALEAAIAESQARLQEIQGRTKPATTASAKASPKAACSAASKQTLLHDAFLRSSGTGRN
ncbi:unnamed protein product [Symbiodinium natans]|uniref:Uncharacterized protein n=1 Tax=Symbiodinium natans TaxID=878477 RepID=A0A812HTD5_9DINO|nr:unnamed protein product [Symbiodinium natans]